MSAIVFGVDAAALRAELAAKGRGRAHFEVPESAVPALVQEAVNLALAGAKDDAQWGRMMALGGLVRCGWKLEGPRR